MLPKRLCFSENRKLITAVLLHELGHIRQRDARGNLLFCIALPILYFHPLFWWLRRDWNLSAELIADDWAARQTGKEKYVKDLVNLARISKGNDLPLVGVSAVFTSPSQFYRRMQMLLAREQPLTTNTSALWQLACIATAALGVALTASLGGIRPALAQSNPAEATTPATPSAAAPDTRPAPAKEAELQRAPESAFSPTRVTNHDSKASIAGEVQSREARVQELRAQQASLEAKLKELQSLLNELGDSERPAKTSGTGLVGPNETIVLTRVDAAGVVWTETWTANEHGKPGKLIKSEERAKVAVKVATQFTPDGKVVKTFEEADGTTIHTYDSATGRLMETRRETARGDKHLSPNPMPLQPTPATTAAAPQVAITPPSRVAVNDPLIRSRTAKSHQLDLLSLATSYADAVGELEAATAKLEVLEGQQKGNSKSISSDEMSSARVAVSAAQRKEQLLNRIAKVSLDSVYQEMERTHQLHKAGNIQSADLEDVRMRAEILKQILDTKSSDHGTGSLKSPSTGLEPVVPPKR